MLVVVLLVALMVMGRCSLVVAAGAAVAVVAAVAAVFAVAVCPREPRTRCPARA